MAARPVPPFGVGTVEQVSRIVGDLYSGSQLSVIIASTRLAGDPGAGLTKWRRIDEIITDSQQRTGTGAAVISVCTRLCAQTRP